jgi:hypothetical protein
MVMSVKIPGGKLMAIYFGDGVVADAELVLPDG